MARDVRQRLGLSLTPHEYAVIAAYARQASMPVARAAKRLLFEAVGGPGADSPAAALDRAQDRIRHLEAEVGRLQARIDQRQSVADLTSLPRWRWPLEALLADRAWWDEWLPRLGELLGRRLEYDRGYGDRQPEPVVDDRGFADLMTYLFPNLRDERGETVQWHSPEYARCALATSPGKSRRRPSSIGEAVRGGKVSMRAGGRAG
jgi:hypothetical protein